MERALRQPLLSATSGKPVAVNLRPGKTPDGAEVALVLRHVIRQIRARWPAVDIVVRGDSHYGRPEAMAWCERQRVGYIFGLSGKPVLLRQVGLLAEDAALGRLAGEGEKVRRWGDFRYAAKTWTVERRVIARLEAGPQGADTRFIVTNLPGTPSTLYEKVYCARGQAENLIKAHKLHLPSDRTSCRKATANQFRLLLHTAAYWLLLTLRSLAPRTSFWRDCPVRYDPIMPAQSRRARNRDGHPRQNLSAECFPLSDRLRRSRRSDRQTATVGAGADAPALTLPRNLKPDYPRRRRHQNSRPGSRRYVAAPTLP